MASRVFYGIKFCGLFFKRGPLKKYSSQFWSKFAKQFRSRRCLTLFHTVLTKNDPVKKPFENILGRGENAGNPHFLLISHFFYPFKGEFQLLKYIYLVVCKCFQFEPV